MRIEEVLAATPDVQVALARLLPQLNPTLQVPDMQRVQALIDDPDVTLLFAKEAGEVIGTATVIVYATPFWLKARIDEVVVDKASRGKGVGEAIVRACLDVARRKGAQMAELQSGRGPQRAIANRMYRQMGFELRDSNLYRLTFGAEPREASRAE